MFVIICIDKVKHDAYQESFKIDTYLWYIIFKEWALRKTWKLENGTKRIAIDQLCTTCIQIHIRVIPFRWYCISNIFSLFQLQNDLLLDFRYYNHINWRDSFIALPATQWFTFWKLKYKAYQRIRNSGPISANMAQAINSKDW